jgi:methyl-accepting chemotaxis protein
MNFTNLKIGQRLGLGFGIVLVLLAALIGVGLSAMSTINESLNGIVQGNNVRIDAAANMRDAQRRISTALRDTMLVSDSARMAAVGKSLESAWRDYDASSTLLAKLVISERGRALMAQIEAARQAAVPLINESRQFALDSNIDDGTRHLMTTTVPAVAKWQAAIKEMIDFQASRNKAAQAAAAGQYDNARLLLIGLGSVALLAAVIIAWLATRSITRPMQEAVRIAQTVAAGNLTSQVEVRSKDETGQLLQALKEMNASLQNIVGQVRVGTDTIATASSEIASGNLDLSSRTEQQASALEETASSMEELTTTVKQNSDNARQANQLAQSASSVAVQGGAVVSQVVETMGSINESARKIVDIIGVIDGIAFQTNILALNAAVEAARAGEQGRGFAVVATEVRNLAHRSAAAAKEIKVLINDSVEKVDMGSRLVNTAGTTMDEVVASVKRVTDIMAEISAASREQESGIDQINKAISEMDTVTQQNAALVEEAAAAAQSLQEQSIHLAEVVSVFELGGAAPSASAKPARAPVTPAATKARALASPAPSRAARKPLAVAAAPSAGSASDWEEF